MKFKLTINLGNDDMQTHGDIAKLLRKLANRLDDNYGEDAYPDNGQGGYVTDGNGNRVGKWEVVDE